MRRLTSDDGFTLSELIVVVGLLGVILGIAWLGYSVTAQGARLSDRESFTSQEIGVPLLEAERLIMQQYDIRIGTYEGHDVNPTDYLFAFDTDWDNDGNVETHIIEATSDHRLIFYRAEKVDSPVLSSFDWSTHNYNVEAGVPLFTYYKADGTQLTDPSVYEDQTRSVKITIVTEHEGKRFSDSRMVSFRKL
ncbi:MAG: prepilin-type N-terminal cleavage/methylation domain-containing protein [Coriobacteriia bacterium]|nr:prepilin-type N-terminal cleavage/methylation domain-containing protein [Coriobacteriia bacterium]